MCGMFSSPSVPAAPEPEAVKAEAERAAKEAEAKQRQQIAGQQGRRSLNSSQTGATGVEDKTLAEKGTLFG